MMDGSEQRLRESSTSYRTDGLYQSTTLVGPHKGGANEGFKPLRHFFR
jgi:hypothetical protein